METQFSHIELQQNGEDLKIKEQRIKEDQKFKFTSAEDLDKLTTEEERREAVKEAFLHCWNSYSQNAWGYDEVKPLSKKGVNNWGGLVVSLVDSLDTMLIMDLKEEYEKARSFIADNLYYPKSYDASVFETTIRHLGGLLSAYSLTSDDLYKKKAIELADCLLPAFDSTTGIPYSTVNLLSGKAHSPSWSGGAAFLSEFGTLQLEFKYLSYISGNLIYAQKVNRVMDVMSSVNVSQYHDLYPSDFHPDRNVFVSDRITFGARGDSFYEYLLKQYLQTYNTETKLWEIYKKTMEATKKLLLLRSSPSNLTYIAEYQGGHIHKMDHLVCFMGGVLALDNLPGHLDIAREITYTCWQMYERCSTGIAPEIVLFYPGEDFIVDPHATYNLLRPEALESIFILYRVTKEKKYQEWGWEIFKSFSKISRVSGGFSGIRHVNNSINQHIDYDDKMESFFLAETLKYLYLLFSPMDLIPLEDYVFNTEAHPLRKFKKDINKE